MSDELRAALRGLAEDAPRVEPGADTFRRGRRARRRTQAAGVLAAAVVVVGGGVALVQQDLFTGGGMSVAQAPSYDEQSLALPDHVYPPTSGVQSIAAAGPVGPLAVVGETVEPDDGSPVVFGVSALTGDYRILSLPDRADVNPVALSPDGTKVAYYVHLSGEGEQPPGFGYAVYDVLSEDVSSRRSDNYTGGTGTATWTADSKRLILRYAEGRNGRAGEVWTLASDTVTLLTQGPLDTEAGGYEGTRCVDDRVIRPGHPASGDTVRIALSVRGACSPVMDESGQRVAYTRATSAASQTPKLYVATVPDREGRRAGVRMVPLAEPAANVVSWVGDDQVAMWEPFNEFEGSGDARLRLVSIETGTTVPLVSVSQPSTWPMQVSFATSLFDRPTFAGERPPEAAGSPTLVLVAVAGTVALGLAVVAVISRRRRARAEQALDRVAS